MTHTITNYLPKSLGSTQAVQFFKTIFHHIAAVKESYHQARKVSETIRELNRLSNSELMDIGLTRGDIYTVAHSKFSDYSDKIATRSNTNLKGWV